MQVGDWEIPEDYESMTCIYNCGYILVWKRSPLGGSDAGNEMDKHIIINHSYPIPTVWEWFKGFRRKGK